MRRRLDGHVAALRYRRRLARNVAKLGARVERIRMSTMAETKAPAARSLSPHLHIYRPMLMMMSIIHRLTGFGLYFGTLLLAWWFIAAAGPNGYARFEWFIGSWIGRLI